MFTMAGGYDFDNPDDELAFDIGMELSRQKVPHRRSKAETRDSIWMRRQTIARKIVQAIKRANWKFEKGPAPRGHSTDWNT